MTPLLVLALATPPAHAEIDPGSALGIRVFEILDDSDDHLGYVVVTGASYSGGTWAAGKDYWFWDDTPFPSGGFALSVYGTTPPTGLAPGDAWRYPNLSFGATTGTCTTNPNTGRWFRLWVGSDVVGWMRDDGSSGARWFALGDAYGVADPFYALASTSQGTEYVRFDGPVGNAPSSISNCSTIFTAQEAAP